jgi:DNA-binding IclR family transcriptional regulator
MIDRVRCEFVEMRGFSPTVEQATRLFQINRDECTRILQGLVEEGFLTQTADGRYRLPSQQ